MASNSGWNKNVPSGTSSIAAGDDDIRSFKSSMQAWWEEEHYATDGSANSAGEHKVGSARAYVGASSEMSNPRTGAIFFSTTDRGIYVAESGSTFSKYLSNELYAATDSINTWQALQKLQGASATSVLFAADVTGDSIARFALDMSGKMEWGAGSGARDTNLYRSAANLLKSDDTLQVANLVVDGGLSISSIQIGSGVTIKTIVSELTNLASTDIGPKKHAVFSQTVSGITVGDMILGVHFEQGGASNDLIITPRGINNGPVDFTIYNNSVATINVSGLTVRISVADIT